MQLRQDPSAQQRISLARPRVQQLFSPDALVPRFYQMAVNLHNTADGAGVTRGAGIAGSAGGAQGADD
jgi:hypothetical protein